jgi:hypothetical protein
MARIRIVDEWIRSPVSPPTAYRTVMVVAEKWAEQRVLMRAYAESRDQIRPTIMLHGQELAIGPASIDANGPWGIHVQPPSDGRAQELQDQLELAARRLAGSKGNPPRLEDEESAFERKPTNNWLPGSQRSDRPDIEHPAQVLPPGALYPAPVGSSGYPPPMQAPMQSPMQPMPPMAQPAISRLPASQAATYVPSLQSAEVVQPGAVGTPAMIATTPSNPSLRKTPVPMPSDRMRSRTPTGNPGRGTALGYQSGAGAQSAVVRLGLNPGVSQRLARLVNRTVPADFQISKLDRIVLNAIGENDIVTARTIGLLLNVADPVGWMESLISKLERYGLDIVEPGPADGGEPTYVLKR